MGTDIYGWIECKTEASAPSWQAVKNLADVYHGRDYTAFGCLFGVRNILDFEPIAADRGLPADISPEVAAEAGYFTNGNLCCHTWITWAQVQQINWEETSKRVEWAIYVYQYTPDGTLKYLGKEYIGVAPTNTLTLSQYDPTIEQAWAFENTTYRTKKVPRKVILPEWQATFDFLTEQGRLYGDNNVRLVVWFD